MKRQVATARIQSAIENHGTGVLQFSGGKDSLAVLHLCRPWHEKIVVLFGDTGDMFPHVVAFVQKACREWGFILETVHPEIPAAEHIARCGLPVDILPMWSHRQIAEYLPEGRKPNTLLQSGFECCDALLWQPMQNAVRDSETTLVLRGSKGTDMHVSATDGTQAGGVEYVSPLWDWTDEDVFEYLRENNVELPLQYQHGCVHSLDCMKCTAWGDTKAEMQRVAFTRKFYPEEFEALRNRMRLVRDETIRQLEVVEPFLNLAED